MTEFNPKMLQFEFNLADADYQLDSLQNKMLQFYLRADMKFKRAFYLNFTNEFLEFIRDKVKLQEPTIISFMGNIRGGKSYSAISICIYHQALQGRLFSADYVCANEFEFLEKVKTMPEDKLKGAIFLIDEEKQAVYGTGSVARKTKMEDVSNIIAINNISVIRICPIRFPAQDVAWYGLRVFGRCFKTKTVRIMLYNLQEGTSGGSLPMGMIYLPIFTEFLPKEFAEPLEKAYLEKKNIWVKKEMRNEMDVMLELKKKIAHSLCRDEVFNKLKKKDEKIVYISSKIGSEYTKGELIEILALTTMIHNGVLIPNDNE